MRENKKKEPLLLADIAEAALGISESVVFKNESKNKTLI